MRKSLAIQSSLFVALLAMVTTIRAEVTLPSWMTSNMVLQQQTTMHLSATAKKGATVKINVSWNPQTVTAKADKKTGLFHFDLKVPAAGGPFTLTFDDGEPKTIDNVMSGEVWFCSGQSNMEMPVNGWGKINNYEQEVANANHPLVRLFQVGRDVSHTPLKNMPIGHTLGWAVCSPEMVADFSATAYFFAREVSQKLGIAVGVVNSSWGGTPAESWVSHEALKGVTGFEQMMANLEATNYDELEIRKLYLSDRDAWQKRYYSADKGLADGDPSHSLWSEATFDDQSWKKMELPAHWKDNELIDLDGVVWFRRAVDIPAELAGKDLKLNLGFVDDQDITYWNGQRIGGQSGWNIRRSYTVPSRLVKPGRNIVTVRVYDTGGDGGIISDAADINIQSGNTKLPLAGSWNYQIGMDSRKINTNDWGVEPKEPNSSWYPSNLYNSMVAPFLNMPIRGFLWYQGCSNVGRAVQYESLFQSLILDWQERFNRQAEVSPYPKPTPTQNQRQRFFARQDSKALPFYFVQIANYLQRLDLQPQSEWAAIREAQRKALQLDGVGMAVNIDIGMANDIHPKNKQEVGRRLALLALNRTYGQEVNCAAPDFYQMRVMDGKAILTFRPVQGSEALASNADIKGFTVAGPDHKWHVARAHTEGERFMQRVIVECPDVPRPVAVRYAWADNPECNLVTTSGLPVGPFRTDDWADFK
ncbi:MAG: 9-O-acetylesterase [Bacteroidaceae bacterium]|nr:9-O-acetylesterase [Bacteroidaceae bacterium]